MEKQALTIHDDGRVEVDGQTYHLLHHETFTIQFPNFDMVCERMVNPWPDTPDEHLHQLGQALEALRHVPYVPNEIIGTLRAIYEEHSPKYGDDYAE